MTTSEQPWTGGSRRMWPTPQAQDARHSSANAENRLAQGRQLQLAHAVGLRNWPAPPPAESPDDQQLTLFAAGSPASQSPSPANASRRRTLVGSGPRSTESFAHWSLGGSSSRTSPDFSIPDGSSPEDAYAAGLIDGEGSLGIQKSHDWYSARVEIGMTEPALAVLRSMQSRYGGTVSKSREATPKWAAAWRWRMFGREATEFVRQIRPLLRLKGPQADLILALESVHRRSPEAARLKEQINELNLKGPRDAPTAAGRWLASQQSLLQEPLTFSGTWPVSGMTRSGTAYQRPSSVPPIYAAESSSWPTPSAVEYGSNQSPSPGAAVRPSLSQMARQGLWPTPRSADGMNDSIEAIQKRISNRDEGRQYRSTLEEAVAIANWPTPTARLGTARGPQAARYTNPARSNDLDDAVAATGTTGPLNPTWVELLMGFPPGWTELPGDPTGKTATPA